MDRLAFTLTTMANNAEPGRSYVLTDTIMHWMPAIEIGLSQIRHEFHMILVPGAMASSRRLISAVKDVVQSQSSTNAGPYFSDPVFGTGERVERFPKAVSRYCGHPIIPTHIQ